MKIVSYPLCIMTVWYGFSGSGSLVVAIGVAICVCHDRLGLDVEWI